jgi:hypothetical protein
MTGGLDIGKLKFIWILEFGAESLDRVATLDQISPYRREGEEDLVQNGTDIGDRGEGNVGKRFNGYSSVHFLEG